MKKGDLELPADPDRALAAIREAATGETAVLLLKLSPICGVSTMAEREVENWLEKEGEGKRLRVAVVDVVGERELARGLTALLGIEHQSPQALFFRGGEVEWHGSHYNIDSKNLNALFDAGS